MQSLHAALISQINVADLSLTNNFWLPPQARPEMHHGLCKQVKEAGIANIRLTGYPCVCVCVCVCVCMYKSVCVCHNVHPSELHLYIHTHKKMYSIIANS